MSEVKGMIKNMKNEWLTFFFILIAGLLTSCSMPNAVESKKVGKIYVLRMQLNLQYL